MNIESLHGVGPSLKNKLNKLNIYTVDDLLENYPFKYNFIHISKLDDLIDDSGMVYATILEEPKVQYIKKNFNRLIFKAMSDESIVNVTIFNRAFLKSHLTMGKQIVLIGKYNKLKNSFMASDIKFNVVNNTIEPVYHLVEGLKNNNVIKLIDESLNNYNVEVDLIPKHYIDKYNFISKKEALNYIHKPKNIEEIKLAKTRLKYEELFSFMFKINYLSNINKNSNGIERDISIESIDNFKNNLEFNLTPDQEKTINDIYIDLSSKKRMNRLILGDVGSGKTIVATYAIYLNFLCKMQSALMAPTEILAYQHFKSISKVLEKYDINIALLTGSMKKSEKKVILDELKNGEIDLLIGTHALISDNVEFNNLSLVITDEQHRFGVGQRNTLSSKGLTPDVLYLSATPIPRTYALTIYGDLDISMIKTKPKGRKEIITKVEKESNIKNVLYKMLDELKNGHQIYVVSPSIETNEESNIKSVNELKDKFNMAFNNNVDIEVLHGKLKQKDKDEIMNNFKIGKTKILISTTVIEVGIDVPNSTMIVIYNAERFGLATLHQLRGRVGRNDFQSYCYLICNSEIERLKVLEESNDGFYISEKDFEMRGQGDLFGVKQSGEVPFKIVDLKEKVDYEMLLQAKKDSMEYINNKMYIDNSYYKSIIEKTSFLN